jgi:hypothetical protein
MTCRNEEVQYICCHDFRVASDYPTKEIIFCKQKVTYSSFEKFQVEQDVTKNTAMNCIFIVFIHFIFC